MLDDNDIKVLTSLLPKAEYGIAHFYPRAGGQLQSAGLGHCVILGPCFVLEVPKEEIKVKNWPDKAYTGPTKEAWWKSIDIPPVETGKPAIAMEVEIPKIKGTAIRLTAGNLVRYIQLPLFKIIERVFLEPKFKLFEGTRPDGSPTSIAVFDGKDFMGIVAAYNVTL